MKEHSKTPIREVLQKGMKWAHAIPQCWVTILISVTHEGSMISNLSSLSNTLNVRHPEFRNCRTLPDVTSVTICRRSDGYEYLHTARGEDIQSISTIYSCCKARWHVKCAIRHLPKSCIHVQDVWYHQALCKHQPSMEILPHCHEHLSISLIWSTQLKLPHFQTSFASLVQLSCASNSCCTGPVNATIPFRQPQDNKSSTMSIIGKLTQRTTQ